LEAIVRTPDPEVTATHPNERQLELARVQERRHARNNAIREL